MKTIILNIAIGIALFVIVKAYLYFFGAEFTACWLLLSINYQLILVLAILKTNPPKPSSGTGCEPCQKTIDSKHRSIAAGIWMPPDKGGA